MKGRNRKEVQGRQQQQEQDQQGIQENKQIQWIQTRPVLAMDGRDFCHGPQPQKESERRTTLQQWWKHSEDLLFPVPCSYGG